MTHRTLPELCVVDKKKKGKERKAPVHCVDAELLMQRGWLSCRKD